MIEISALGMTSSLGKGAVVNAAAMRCGYDGFEVGDAFKGLTFSRITLKSNVLGYSHMIFL